MFNNNDEFNNVNNTGNGGSAPENGNDTEDIFEEKKVDDVVNATENRENTDNAQPKDIPAAERRPDEGGDNGAVEKERHNYSDDRLRRAGDIESSGRNESIRRYGPEDGAGDVRRDEIYRDRQYDCDGVRDEGVGIRYNADENSKDGNYTWQYYKTGEGGFVQSPVPVKKKNKALKVIGIIAASVAGTILIGFVSLAVLRYLNGDEFIPFEPFEGEYPSENVEPDIPGNKGDVPVIGRKDDGDSDTKNDDILVIPDENGKLTKQMIAVKCKPSAVGIEVKAITQSYFGNYESRGVGSGFILTEDGYIATNNHVIEGADEITVMLDDGTKYEATVIGTDALTDLAVIKIEANGLTPIEIGDSDLMRVGDSVIAIGTPAGIEFAGTVTDGIVSAVNRAVEVKGSSGYNKTMHLMQTNAAINPGNSGGPLINDRGEVVGINTLKLTEEYEGIGFSIPINSAVNIFNQLIKDGKVSDYEHSFVTGTGSIGIARYDVVTKEHSKYYGVPTGIMVLQMKSGSSAQKAGLKRGDIITAFNGTRVESVEELNQLKSNFKAGDEVTITVYRDPDEYVDITFKLDIQG